MGNHECVSCICFHYRRKQILIGFCIRWEWISLGTDARAFCCSNYLSFKLLQNLTGEVALFSGTWIWKCYFTVFSKVLFFSLVSSFIVLPFFLLHVLFFDSIFLFISVVTDCVKKLNPSEALIFFKYLVKQDLS